MKMFRSVFPLLWLLALPSTTEAARPTDEIKATTDKILALMNDADLKGDAKKSERHRLIRAILNDRFDWAGIARSCLGRHWSKRSRPEQKEFIGLFSEFLERTYLDKFETYYQDLDKIDYLGERIIDTYASVKIVVTTKQKIDHPVEYRLQQSVTGKIWRIYDVIVEGVSLVKNYRDQFDELIAKSSYEQLISDLKSKLETSRQGTGAKPDQPPRSQ